MANHITNKLILDGDIQDVKKLIEQYSTFFEQTPHKSNHGWLTYNKIGELDFGWLDENTNKFYLRGIEESVGTGVPEGYEQHFEEAWTRFPDFAKVVHPPNDDAYNDLPNQEIAENSLNWWYTWNRENWGTKYNSYQCKQVSINEFTWETAWKSVPKIIEKISQEHPNVTMYYSYADENFGHNTGKGVFRGGVIEFIIFESKSEEAIRLATELLGNPHEDNEEDD